MITIRNSFHGTKINLNASIGDELSTGQIARARNVLCGISDCQCGGAINERGKQDGFRVEQIDYQRVALVAD